MCIDSIYQLNLIRSVKLNAITLKTLRNKLFAKYRPDIYAAVNPDDDSTVWEEVIFTNPDLTKHAGLSMKGHFEELLEYELSSDSEQMWLCEHDESIDAGHIILFPRNITVTETSNINTCDESRYRNLACYLDTSFSDRPFVLIGIVTASFNRRMYEESNSHGQLALSGTKVEEIDCRHHIHMFLSKYYTTDETNNIMSTYGTYVYDFLS